MNAIQTQETAQGLYNLEAELMCIGSIFIDPDIAARMQDALEIKDFHDARHRHIYMAMCNLWNNGHMIDMTMVSDELESLGTLDDVGRNYITEFLYHTPTSLYFDHYASIVKKLSFLRRWVVFAGNVTKQAYDRMHPDELYSFVQSELKTLQPPKNDGALMPWDESFDAYHDVLRKRIEIAQAGPQPTRWPWKTWNNLIDPAEPGLPVVISGSDGTGKTIYLENIADFWAMQGLNVVLAHAELNRGVMMDRRICRHAGVSRRVLKSGVISDEDGRKIEAAEERLRQWPGKIHYLYTPGWNVDELTHETARLRDFGQCDALVFDYMDKLSASPRQIREFGSNHIKRESDDMGKVKDLAEVNSICLVTATQLRKSGKESSFQSLRKEDIGGSGDKTNYVNVVALIHRATSERGEVNQNGQHIVKPGGLCTTVNVKIDKNTLGETGTFEQIINPSRFAVTDPPILGARAP